MSETREENILFARGSWWAWAVLLLGFVITGAAWKTSNDLVQTNARQHFDADVNEITSAIYTRMIGYEQVLWGGVGFINASDNIDRAKFRTYVGSLNIEKNWPGIQGIGFSVPVRPDEKAAHIASVRAEGFPDYTIKPPGPRPAYSAIIYLEPFDWRNKRAFGYDMWSNDMRRQAMQRARDEGVAATSGIITLVQETDEDVQKGFLTYLPLYRRDAPVETVEQRRSAFVGWVYSPFRMGNLMQGILGPRQIDVDYEIFDGATISKDSMLYDSNDVFHPDLADAGDITAKTETINIQGRTWILRFTADNKRLRASDSNEPLLVAATGVVVSFLLFSLILSLALLQKRAEILAHKMTAGLDEANAKLAENVRQLSISNEELSNFAYVASHDLQEPLRMVASFCNLLKSDYGDKLDDTGREYLDFAVDGAKRMKSLVEGLLAYSRVGQEAPKFTDVDCNQVYQTVLADLQAAIEENEAVVTCDPLPVVTGDATMLHQLFQNLIMNAIKFRTDAPPVIHVSANRQGKSWLFAVADNGIGIPAEFADQVFVIYKRLNKREDYPGSGMGLAVCRKIVDRHHGRIWVDANRDQGSVFYFTLPTGQKQ